ncbi:MAG: FmdB family transcriptional regulator [Deltaproteobacteria bacterium]|nr:FmdB family transcriptional regulator [Deltaproteobacteria bacterium]
MPIYEYECAKCGHQFEREQRMSDSPVKTCPVCKARKVNKLISRSSFVLKGGGWYADGYADASGAKDTSDAKDASKDKAESSTVETKSADAKPAKNQSKKQKKATKKKGSSKSAA